MIQRIQRSSRASRTIRGIASLLLLAHLGGLGCQTAPKQDERVRQIFEEVTAQELRGDLRRWADRAVAGVSATASDIAWQTQDREVREFVLRWRIRTVPAVQHVIFAEDPRVGLLEAWIVAAQQRNRFRSPEMEALLGKQVERARGGSDRIYEDIASIARQYVPEERFADAEQAVAESAREYQPLHGHVTAMIQVSEADAAGRGGGLGSVLAIPISGVSEGADAINRLARMAGIIAELVETLPQYTRWQLEMLLLELDSIGVVQRSQENFERLSASIASIAETAGSLPEKVRAELATFLEGADASQESLRSTLEEARATVQQLDATVTKADQVATTISDTTVRFQEAAVAWESTADAANSLVAALQAMREPVPGQEATRPFDINDYTQAAERVHDVTVELRSLLVDLETGKLSTVVSQLGETSQSSIDHAALRTAELVDRLTWRALMVVAVLVVGLVLYRVVAAWLAGRDPGAAG